MSIKIITEKKRALDLEFADVNIEKWDKYGAFKLTENILIIDSIIYYRNYGEGSRDNIAKSILGLQDKIDQFLRTGGVIITLMSPPIWHNPDTINEDFVRNDDLFGEMGITFSAGGIQEYECYLQDDNKWLKKYVNMVGKSDCYLEYNNTKFEKETELITRGKHGSVCGAAFRSYDGSGNGSVIFLPRPNDLTVRPKEWFKYTILSSLDYIPEETREDIMPESDEEGDVDGESGSSKEYESIGKILRICERFPRVALELENRYDNRNTIEINDEYDVQDLLHGILWVDFNDVREEEYSPSHGGSNSRIDFLLKDEKIGIEVKYASNSNKEKELKNQLAEDKEHYKAHSDCENLVCFIYDPEFVIENPSGFEKDLSSKTGNLPTEVLISPKTPAVPIKNS